MSDEGRVVCDLYGSGEYPAMNRSLEVLLNGMQFRKLLEKELEALRGEYDLCKIDVQILFYLYKAEDRNTPRDIVELKLFTKGHISQSLARMQKRNLIVMVHDEKDRRCMHILLCPDAESIIQQVCDVYERVNADIFHGITEEEKRSFISVAKKINKNIQNTISEKSIK